MRKKVWVLCAVVWMMVGFAGCGEHAEEKQKILLVKIVYNKPDGTSAVEREYEYDSLGNKTRELRYYFDGDIMEWAEWEYDAFGSLVKEKGYTPYSSAVEWPEEYWREREYDLSGNLTKENWYNFDGGIGYWREYEYDVSGNLAKIVYYDSDGNVEYQVAREYDEFCNQIIESHSTLYGINWIEWVYDSPENPTHETETHYDWDGSIYGKYERTYMSTGSLTRETEYSYSEDGEIRWGYELEYDSFGNRITQITYGENGSISSRCEWEYDSPENPTKEMETHYNSDGSISGRDEREYNAFGNITKAISYDVDGNVKENWWMEWEYDECGNRTKKIWYNPDGSIMYWYDYEYITMDVITNEEYGNKYFSFINYYAVNRKQESLHEETDAWEAEETSFGDGESQEEAVSDEPLDNNDTAGESPAVEEVHGRIPASTQCDSEIMDYDPEDTIYYKTYYDDFFRGKIMNIDYSPYMEIREELEDYFVDDSEIFYLDYLVSMFYDDRTIETDEKELEQLFWEHGYILYFHSAEYQDLHLRFIEIAEKEGLSLYPIRILMQTWDDDYIYLQNITGPIPRKIKDLMVVDRDGVWQLIVHSSGFSKEYIPEEELSFWEFTGSDWILVPMALEIDTSNAFAMGDLYPDMDRDGLYEAIYYRDGIAFRSSMQPVNDYGTQDNYRLGIMEIIEENKKFRLITVNDVLGITCRSFEYIQFTIK